MARKFRPAVFGERFEPKWGRAGQDPSGLLGDLVVPAEKLRQEANQKAEAEQLVRHHVARMAPDAVTELQAKLAAGKKVFGG